MDLLLFVIFLIFILPICLLFHELGHGILAVFYTKSDVHIYVGLVDEDDKENFRIGRLHFHIAWGYEGFAQWEGELNKWQRAVVIAGGPIISLLLLFLFDVSAFLINQDVLYQLVLYSENGCFMIFVMSTLPIPYPPMPRWLGGGRVGGYPSDGLQLLQLLRSKSQ